MTCHDGLLQRVKESAAVTFYIFCFLFVGPFLWLGLSLGFLTPCWPVSALYLLWWLWDLTSPSRGGRSGPLVAWCRGLAVWPHFAAYFPVTLVKTANLDPGQKYVLCCHPHGVLCFGAAAAFGTEAADWSKLFPGLLPRLTSLQGNLLMPLFREFFMLAGAVSASRASLDYLLEREDGHGEVPVLMVGGVPEMENAAPGEVRLYLSRRKGFCKLALRHGVALVPCMVFGETQLYNQHSLLASKLRGVTDTMRTCLGIAPVVLTGQGWLQGTLGLLPARRPLKVVVGAPLLMERVEQPTEEQVTAVHRRYVTALRKLYCEHNTETGVRLVIV